MIETARLQMRPLALSDLDDLHRLFTDPGVRRFLLDDQIVSREWTEAEIISSMKLFESDGHGMWAVCEKGEGALVGFCGYRFFNDPAELQLLYGIAPEYWSRGLTTEAAKAMIRYAFSELRFTRIVASADAPNLASFRVMEKAGMKFEKRVTIEGRDTIYYAIEEQ
jgi:ribosomal-protein-alanine N-acetyltransferase